MNFSPFNTSFDELSVSDLVQLQEVSEGWYIEYKRELVNTRDIAKSISAMANTYGGWVFFGIVEKSKKEPVAGTFPGISVSELEPAKQQIRQSVYAHLNPICHFDVVALTGPSDALGLPKDQAVIVIHIPQSFDTPHIHSSGRIYRRIGDGSEPEVETNRDALRELWLRREVKEKSERSKRIARVLFEELEQAAELLAIDLDVGHKQPSIERHEHLIQTVKRVRRCNVFFNAHVQDLIEIPNYIPNALVRYHGRLPNHCDAMNDALGSFVSINLEKFEKHRHLALSEAEALKLDLREFFDN